MTPLYSRFTETVTVKRTTSHTDAGDPVRGSSFTVRARVERKEIEQGDVTSRTIDTDHRFFTDTEIQQGDLVFFAEDNPANDDTGHRVIDVEKKVRLDGSPFMFTVRC